METVDIIIVIIFGANAVLPLVLGELNYRFSCILGWSAATVWFCVSKGLLG